MQTDNRAEQLANEAAAAVCLAACALWNCVKYPRAFVRLLSRARSWLPRRPGLSADELAALRALIAKGGA